MFIVKFTLTTFAEGTISTNVLLLLDLSLCLSLNK